MKTRFYRWCVSATVALAAAFGSVALGDTTFGCGEHLDELQATQTLGFTKTFLKWRKDLERQTEKQLQSRLDRITEEAHFGDMKRFRGIIELRWGNGLRVYLGIDRGRLICLGGGTKHQQQRDIDRAIETLAEIRSGDQDLFFP